jgi:hypothetical protein
MLQTNSLSLSSLRRGSVKVHPTPHKQAQRSQVAPPSNRSLETFCESLPADLSANKKAMINRLVALYEHGASS